MYICMYVYMWFVAGGDRTAAEMCAYVYMYICMYVYICGLWQVVIELLLRCESIYVCVRTYV